MDVQTARNSPPSNSSPKWVYWLGGQPLFNGLSKGYRKLRATLEKSPSFDKLDGIAKEVTGRVYGIIRLPAGLETRLDPLLEIETARKVDPIVVLAILALFAGLGLYPSSLGHMDTTPHLFTLLPFVGVFNPYLGVCSAVVFAVFDWAGKWLYPILSIFGSWVPAEGVYGGNWSDGAQNFFGARIGYLFAYSTVLLTALLPGVLARVFRVVTYRIARVFFGRPAVGGGAAVLLLGAAIMTLSQLTGSGDAFTQAAIPMVLLATSAASMSMGAGNSEALAQALATLGSIAGAGFGGALGNIYARGLGNYLAFEVARATPDLSCRALSAGNYMGHLPWTVAAGGMGGLFPRGAGAALFPGGWFPPVFGGLPISGNPESLVSFKPPGGMPEGIPEERPPRSEDPECDELFGRLREAINRFRKAQAERERVWGRLQIAHAKQQLNTMTMIIRTGVEVGGYAAAGAGMVRGATRNVGRRAANVIDDIRAAKARSAMLAEPTRQIQARLAQIRGAIKPLDEASQVVERLAREQDNLDKWVLHEIRKPDGWHAKAPPASAGYDFENPVHRAAFKDLAILETTGIAKRSILDDIARQGFAKPAQRAELKRLTEAAAEAQKRQLHRRADALRRGWKPDVDDYLRTQDPEKLKRFYENSKQLAEARRRMKDAEKLAPPYLREEMKRLEAQLEYIQRMQAQGALPEGMHPRFTASTKPGTGPAKAVDDPTGAMPRRLPPVDDPTGVVRRPPPPVMSAVPSNTGWVPKPPEWIRSKRKAVESGIGYVLSPIGRLFRWLFVGEMKPQSPQEVGRLMQQGIDTIKRLAAEHEAKQAVVDEIRGEVERMRSGLERCNESWR